MVAKKFEKTLGDTSDEFNETVKTKQRAVRDMFEVGFGEVLSADGSRMIRVIYQKA